MNIHYINSRFICFDGNVLACKLFYYSIAKEDVAVNIGGEVQNTVR